MNNNNPLSRPALKASIISGVAGFINGVWVVLAGTISFYDFSPYSWILDALFPVSPRRFIFFHSGLQFILAPLLGVLIGAVIGWRASRSGNSPAASLLLRAAIAGGIGGFLSLGIIYLNIYAS